MLKLLIFRCTRCSETGAHSDHFLLHINTLGAGRIPETVQAPSLALTSANSAPSACSLQLPAGEEGARL